MGALHQFVVAGLLASLGLVAASCVAETTDLDAPDPDAVSEGSEGRSEGALADPDVEPQGAWCRPAGAYCEHNFQCCSHDCYYGECRGGGYCKHAGEYCHKNYECCSHDCYGGECLH